MTSSFHKGAGACVASNESENRSSPMSGKLRGFLQGLRVHAGFSHEARQDRGRSASPRGSGPNSDDDATTPRSGRKAETQHAGAERLNRYLSESKDGSERAGGAANQPCNHASSKEKCKFVSQDEQQQIHGAMCLVKERLTADTGETFSLAPPAATLTTTLPGTGPGRSLAADAREIPQQLSGARMSAPDTSISCSRSMRTSDASNTTCSGLSPSQHFDSSQMRSPAAPDRASPSPGLSPILRFSPHSPSPESGASDEARPQCLIAAEPEEREALMQQLKEQHRSKQQLQLEVQQPQQPRRLKAPVVPPDNAASRTLPFLRSTTADADDADDASDRAGSVGLEGLHRAYASTSCLTATELPACAVSQAVQRLQQRQQAEKAAARAARAQSGMAAAALFSQRRVDAPSKSVQRVLSAASPDGAAGAAATAAPSGSPHAASPFRTSTQSLGLRHWLVHQRPASSGALRLYQYGQAGSGGTAAATGVNAGAAAPSGGSPCRGGGKADAGGGDVAFADWLGIGEDVPDLSHRGLAARLTEARSSVSFTEGIRNTAERLQALVDSAPPGDPAASYLQNLLMPDTGASTVSSDLIYSGTVAGVSGGGAAASTLPSILTLAYGSTGSSAAAATTSGLYGSLALAYGSNSGPQAHGGRAGVGSRALAAAVAASPRARSHASGVSVVDAAEAPCPPRVRPHEQAEDADVDAPEEPGAGSEEGAGGGSAGRGEAGAAAHVARRGSAPVVGPRSQSGEWRPGSSGMTRTDCTLQRTHTSGSSVTAGPGGGGGTASASTDSSNDHGTGLPACPAAQLIDELRGLYAAAAASFDLEAALRAEELTEALWQRLRVRDGDATSYVLGLDPGSRANAQLAGLINEMRSYVYTHMW